VRTHTTRFWNVCYYCFATERLILNPPLPTGRCIFHLFSYFRLMTITTRCLDLTFSGSTRARASTHIRPHTGKHKVQHTCQKLCVCVCVCRLFIYVPDIKGKHHFSVFQMVFIGTPRLGELKICVPRGTYITIKRSWLQTSINYTCFHFLLDDDLFKCNARSMIIYYITYCQR
jgi:hypothetical protein